MAAAAARPLCRGAVALCVLFYLRLQRGRRLRDAARRARAIRCRLAAARNRRRFAALWLWARLGPPGRSLGPAAAAPGRGGGGGGGRERRLWSKARSSAFWDTVRAKAFSRGEWAENFRLAPSTFDFLCGRLRAAIQRRDTSMRRAVPAEVRLALTLWRLGACTEYRAVEQQFGVSRSTVCKILRDVCEAVVAILAPLYARPPSRAHGFALPQLAGVLTRLRVPIRAPPDNAPSYSTGRGWHVVVLQAAVDCRGCFWNIEVNPPGQGLRRSALYQRAQRGGLCPAPPARFGEVSVPPFLLGRPSDPLLPWLLRPYGGSEVTKRTGAGGGAGGRRRFNAGAARAEAEAAAALGRLRGRWRCLQKRNDTDLSFLPTLLAACCLLHNVCQARGDPCPAAWLAPPPGLGGEDEEEEAEEDEEGRGEAEAAARRIREALAAALQE